MTETVMDNNNFLPPWLQKRIENAKGIYQVKGCNLDCNCNCGEVEKKLYLTQELSKELPKNVRDFLYEICSRKN